MKFQDPQPIEVELDKKRSLILTMGAMRLADQKIKELRGDKRSIYEVINEEIGAFGSIIKLFDLKDKTGVKLSDFKMSLDFLSVMMWASMLDQEPDLTFEAAERLVKNPLMAQTVVPILVYRTFFEGENNANKQEGEPRPLALTSNGNDSSHSLVSNSE